MRVFCSLILFLRFSVARCVCLCTSICVMFPDNILFDFYVVLVVRRHQHIRRRSCYERHYSRAQYCALARYNGAERHHNITPTTTRCLISIQPFDANGMHTHTHTHNMPKSKPSKRVGVKAMLDGVKQNGIVDVGLRFVCGGGRGRIYLVQRSSAANSVAQAIANGIINGINSIIY